MDTLSLGNLTDVSLRSRWKRHRRLLIGVVVVLLVIGSFLEWGPIGFGNGPVRIGTRVVQSGATSGRLPIAVVMPIGNSGGSALVVDSVQLLGDGSAPAPRVLASEAISNANCGNVSPVRTTATGFVLTAQGCTARPLGPLYGRAIGNKNSAAIAAAFEVASPRPGTCWLVTRIVTHYRVGIRHYVATDPYVLAVCAGSTATAKRIADTAAGLGS